MKKRIALICLLAALCLAAAAAAGEGFGTAVIDAGNSTKLHLRAEPSAESDSRGLYFTGTRVECESNPEKTWVKVRIGTQGGYMKSSFLRRGEAADRVVPRQPVGVVTAKNWANLRTGPSTEYQLAGRVNAGEQVTILGETAEHWYWVEADGEYGFVSAKLVSMQESPSGAAGAAAGWREAYRAYVRADTNGRRYALIYVNDDDVPELAVSTDGEAGGCQILTYANGRVDLLQTSRLHFTYLKRGNLLCNSDGHMGYYYDLISRIENGRWVEVASGYYSGDGEWDEAKGRYVCDSYEWNGVAVTEKTYMQSLRQIYDETRAVDPFESYPDDGCTKSDMLALLGA